MPTKKKSVDFEAKIRELETLVETMETGNLSLDESLKAFEAGIKITRECQQALQQAEQKVEFLSREEPSADQENSAD